MHEAQFCDHSLSLHDSSCVKADASQTIHSLCHADAGDNSMQADAAEIEAEDQNGAVVGEEDEDLVAEADERARARHTGQPAVLSVAASPDGYAHCFAPCMLAGRY